MAEFKWRGDKAMAIMRGAAIQALGVCGSDLQRKSAEQAPIETGDLRANCSVSPVQQEGEKVFVTVGYNLVYARVQHERLDFRHPRGGKAKFLEDPYKENVTRYNTLIGAAVKQGLLKE